jgi:glycerophosphoryl diester phosphodiesterase
MIATALALGASAVTTVLTLRYLRHQPRNFHRHFPGFKPALATHRGYGKHAAIPENTLLAFRSSEKRGFRAHELDVRRTKDGKIMLLHGPRLEETTNGAGRMEELSAAEIAKLDAAHYLLREYPQVRHRHEKVPTLAEVLEAIHPESLINVELKRDRWDFSYGLEAEALRVVLASSARNRVFFSSFHFLTLWRLRRLRCPLPVGLLVEPGIFTHAKNFLYRFLLLPDNIHLHQSRESAGYMRRLKRRGFGLAFWTVNDLEQAQRLFQQGADVVITDRMEFIEHFAPKPPERRTSKRPVQKKASRKPAARR